MTKKKKINPIEGALLNKTPTGEMIFDEWGKEHLVKIKPSEMVILQEPKVTDVARLRVQKALEANVK